MVLPLLVIGVGVHLGVSSYQRLFDTEPTEGIVVGIEERKDGDSYRPIVEYSIGRKIFRCHGAVWSNPVLYKVGEPVTVRYKKDNPQDASIDSFFQNWLGSLVFLGGGGLFEIVMLALIVQRWRRRSSLHETGKLSARLH